MMKYKVIYFTEFGSRETILEESELVRFTDRFKVSSIKALGLKIKWIQKEKRH